MSSPSPRPGEEVGVRYPVVPDSMAQGVDNVVLATNLPEKRCGR